MLLPLPMLLAVAAGCDAWLVAQVERARVRQSVPAFAFTCPTPESVEVPPVPGATDSPLQLAGFAPGATWVGAALVGLVESRREALAQPPPPPAPPVAETTDRPALVPGPAVTLVPPVAEAADDDAPREPEAPSAGRAVIAPKNTVIQSREVPVGSVSDAGSSGFIIEFRPVAAVLSTDAEALAALEIAFRGTAFSITGAFQRQSAEVALGSLQSIDAQLAVSVPWSLGTLAGAELSIDPGLALGLATMTGTPGDRALGHTVQTPTLRAGLDAGLRWRPVGGLVAGVGARLGWRLAAAGVAGGVEALAGSGAVAGLFVVLGWSP